MSFTGFFQNVTDVVGNFLKVTCEEDLHCSTNQFLEAANACGVSFQSALETAWNTCANFCITELANRDTFESVQQLHFFATTNVCKDSSVTQCLAGELDPNASICPIEDFDWKIAGITIGIYLGASILICSCIILAARCGSKNNTPIAEAAPDELTPLSRV